MRKAAQNGLLFSCKEFIIHFRTREVSMEIKINKEIRNYKETIFFGLSMRQFVCSVLAVGVAVGLYFGLSRIADRETVSWVCIVG